MNAPPKRPRGRPRKVTLDPQPVLSQPDLWNFIHLCDGSDFSFLDSSRLFFSYCDELRFNPYDPTFDIAAHQIWNSRKFIRPTATTPINIINAADSSKLNDVAFQEEIIRQFLPLDDIRRQFIPRQIAMYNSASVKHVRRHYRQYLTPDVLWTSRFIGERCLYGPHAVEMHGIDAVVKYHEAIMGFVPDAWHHCHRSDIYLLTDGSMTLVFYHLVCATKVFRGQVEGNKKVVIREDGAVCGVKADASAEQSAVVSTSTIPPSYSKEHSSDSLVAEDVELIDFRSKEFMDSSFVESVANDDDIQHNISNFDNKCDSRKRPREESSDSGVALSSSSSTFETSKDYVSSNSSSVFDSSKQEEDFLSNTIQLQLQHRELLPEEATAWSMTVIIFYAKPKEKFHRVELLHSGRLG